MATNERRIKNLGARAVALLALLVAELFAGIALFAIPDVSPNAGWVGGLVAAANDTVRVSIAFAATLTLILVSRRTQLVSDLNTDRHPRWWLWLCCHFVALAAFLWLSRPFLLADVSDPALSAGWLAAWLSTAIACFACLLLAIAPGAAWRRVARREWTAFAVAAAMGLLAWQAGILVQRIWEPLATMTLWWTHALLSRLLTDVYFDPESAIVGTETFMVSIAPECSGYEGIALITVFVAVYLWLFRRQLRFPAAYLLFPVAIVAIWVANVIRVTALIWIGAVVSEDIAVGGFHSQAGWIAFSVISLGVIAASHRYLLAVAATPGAAVADGQPGMQPAALLAPLLVLLAASMLVTAFSDGLAALYPLAVLATGATLWYFRHEYARYLRAPRLWAVLIGVVVFAVWLVLVPSYTEEGSELAARLSTLPTWSAAIWILFRVLGSVVTVPIAEELAFRGYLMRKLVASDFENVSPGRFTWMSFGGSSVLFGLLHQSLLAGTIAGAGFAGALYLRGQISDAIAAHMTANALIAIAVLTLGAWGLWA